MVHLGHDAGESPVNSVPRAYADTGFTWLGTPVRGMEFRQEESEMSSSSR